MNHRGANPRIMGALGGETPVWGRSGVKPPNEKVRPNGPPFLFCFFCFLVFITLQLLNRTRPPIDGYTPRSTMMRDLR